MICELRLSSRPRQHVHEPGFYLGLVSVIMASWGNDKSVLMVVATKERPWLT